MDKAAAVSNSKFSAGYCCEWLCFVYTIEQTLFLHELYVKCDSCQVEILFPIQYSQIITVNNFFKINNVPFYLILS
jgi:hypothetical protein